MNHLKTRWKRQKEGIWERIKKVFQAETDLEEKNPETIAMEDLEEERIRDAVQGLPESLRTIVLLYYFEEFSVSEVTTALGIGEEGVKSRLFRARKLLREALESG